ncbi:MAG: HNH endonuclease domain-containing protein [Cyclonatronaceae bacterium]
MFKQVTDYYDAVGGYAVLEYDMMNGGIPDSIAPVVNSLCMKIRETILKQPMRYIGSSVYGEQYQIFKPVKNTFSRISSEQFNTVSMVQHYGFFTIPRAYYDVFELLGSFITGTHSILLHWAQFTVGTSKNKLKLEQVMQALTDYPPEVRQMQLSRRYFGEYARESGQLHCVWSGRSLASEMHIDHVIPFSISRNNALWNLMPAHKAINIRKSDKIPSAELLDERRDFIIRQWNFMREKEPVLFEREMSFDLITKDKVSSSTWADEAYNALKHRCRYLADVRGLASFTL